MLCTGIAPKITPFTFFLALASAAEDMDVLRGLNLVTQCAVLNMSGATEPQLSCRCLSLKPIPVDRHALAADLSRVSERLLNQTYGRVCTTGSSFFGSIGTARQDRLRSAFRCHKFDKETGLVSSLLVFRISEIDKMT